MKLLRKIIVATDSRLCDQCIVESAFELARHHGATLTIVSVVQRLNWAAKLAVEDVEGLRSSLRNDVTEQLRAIAKPYLQKGVEVETKLLEGKTSISLIREVIAGDYDLLIAVGRGKDSRASGTFGQTAKQLLRSCPCPLLLTPRGVLPEFIHVAACLDTSTEEALDAELNDKVYRFASAVSEQQKARLSILHAWKMEDEALLRVRLKSKAVDTFVQSAYDYRKSLLHKFLKQFRSDNTEDDVHLLEGEAPEALGEFIADENVDLVVMGTVARSGLFGLLIGNTAEKILEKINCSVLALKPYGFKCPIK